MQATYLGGLPGFKAFDGNLTIQPDQLSMAKYFKPLFNVRRSSVEAIEVINSETEHDKRFTVTRLAIFGPFALGMPKKSQHSSTLVEVKLKEGYVFGLEFKLPEAQVRRALSGWFYPLPNVVALPVQSAPPISGVA